MSSYCPCLMPIDLKANLAKCQGTIQKSPIERLNASFHENRKMYSRLDTTCTCIEPRQGKPAFAICEKKSGRSACLSMQSDQRFYCSLPG